MNALERELAMRLGLSRVVLRAAAPHEGRPEAVGRAVASFLDNLVERPATVACGWGRTVRFVAAHARRLTTSGVTVTDVIGRAAWWAAGDTPLHLSDALASAYGARLVPLDAPAFAASAQEARLLRARPDIVAALATARQADAIVVSPGVADPENSSVMLTGGATSDELRALRDREGVVGDIVGHFFDGGGRIVPHEPSEARAIRVTAADLRSGNVVLLASGSERLGMIRAAARGHLMKTLITDEATGSELLDSL